MSDEHKIIGKQVGLVGATALTVGNAIAITIFLLPAHLLAEGAGPSIALAAIVIMVPLVFSVALALQLGGAIPAAGGGYLYVSRLVGPFWGFVTIWMAVPAIWLGLIFTGYGFAEYVRFFLPMTVDLPFVAPFEVPELSIETLIVALLVPFLIINLLGIRLVTSVQFVMVALIIAGMLAFILPGILQVDATNYTPMFPEGAGPFAVATVSLYIAMYGYGLPLSLGEEIKDPIKNIPRAIALSAAIGVTLIVATVIVAVGVVEWTEWSGSEAGISVVATHFLPPWVAAFVAIVALFGALTTVNTLYVGFSRLVMRAARDWIFPPAFAEVSERFDSPNRAVLLLGLPPIFLVPFAPSPVVMSIVMSLALLLSIIFLAAAAWQLPKVFPQRYEHSFFKLSPRVLAVCVAGGVVVPGLFWMVLLIESPLVGLALLGLISLGYPVYRFRLWWYGRRGVDLKDRMKGLDAHEAEVAAGDD